MLHVMQEKKIVFWYFVKSLKSIGNNARELNPVELHILCDFLTFDFQFQLVEIL